MRGLFRKVEIHQALRPFKQKKQNNMIWLIWQLYARGSPLGSTLELLGKLLKKIYECLRPTPKESVLVSLLLSLTIYGDFNAQLALRSFGISSLLRSELSVCRRAEVDEVRGWLLDSILRCHCLLTWDSFDSKRRLLIVINLGQ